MDTYWIPSVNYMDSLGRSAFAEFTEVYQVETDFKSKIVAEVDKLIATAALPKAVVVVEAQ